MITTKPLKATCVDGDRHRRHGDACLARDRRGRALCVLCAEAKFRDGDDAPTTTERLALCAALDGSGADASAQDDAMLREAILAAARLGGLGSGPYPLRCLAAWALAAIAQSDEGAVAEPLRLRLLEIAVEDRAGGCEAALAASTAFLGEKAGCWAAFTATSLIKRGRRGPRLLAFAAALRGRAPSGAVPVGMTDAVLGALAASPDDRAAALECLRLWRLQGRRRGRPRAGGRRADRPARRRRRRGRASGLAPLRARSAAAPRRAVGRRRGG